jgi:hypothetical protein
MFTTPSWVRRRMTTGGPGARRDLSPELVAALPPRFEAVGEALASGSGSVAACEVVGGLAARDGLSLAEALDALAATSGSVSGRQPAYDEVRALSVAWSEATLGYLHGLSCDDPLTGLASLAHLRSRVADVYRGSGSPSHDHALVVVAAPPAAAPAGEAEVLGRTLRTARLGEAARSVFAGAETIGGVAPGRVVVLAERDDRIGRRVGLLRRLLDGGAVPHARVWIEGLPDSDHAAARLLDELARA